MIIKQDKVRITIYALMYLALALVAFYLTALTYSYKQYVFAFVSATLLWFMIKFMLRYARILIKDEPCLDIEKDGFTMYVLGEKPVKLNFSQVDSAELLYKGNSLKLIVKTPTCKHPSGFYYVGITYWFKKKEELKDIQKQIVDEFKKYHVNVKEIKEN